MGWTGDQPIGNVAFIRVLKFPFERKPHKREHWCQQICIVYVVLKFETSNLYLLTKYNTAKFIVNSKLRSILDITMRSK